MMQFIIWVKRTRMDIMHNSVTLEPKYTNLKTDPINNKKNVVYYFVYMSHYLVTK